MTARHQSTAQSQWKKIFIVDEHPVLRQALAKLLSHERDLLVCGQAENARQAFQAIGRLKPDAAVVNISLDGKTGLELIRDIRARYPQMPVLVMSMHDEPTYAQRALRAGGRGYAMKHEGGKRLVQAIRHVLSGRIYLSERLSTTMLDRRSGGQAIGVLPLQNLAGRLGPCRTGRGESRPGSRPPAGL